MRTKKKKKGKEKRKRRATTEEFMDDVDKHVGGGGGGLFLNIKKEEKQRVIGYIHPIGMVPRKIHASSIPSRVEDDEGNVRVRGRRFNEAEDPDEDPINALMKFAKQKIDDDEADEGMLVLDGGKDRRWTLGELAQMTKGREAYRRDLTTQREYIVLFVKRTKDRTPDNPVQIITAGKGLARAIRQMIASQVDEFGKPDGDPLESPYPVKLVYREKADPFNKYGAERVSEKLAPLDEETEELLDKEEDDLNLGLDTHLDPGHVGDMMHAIESCWECKEIGFDEFKEFMGGAEDDEEPEADDDDEEYDDDDDDDVEVDDEDDDDEEEEEKPKKAKGSRKVKCPDCGKRVVPDKKDRCPNCKAVLDSDVPL
jgi:hypothetical protein